MSNGIFKKAIEFMHRQNTEKIVNGTRHFLGLAPVITGISNPIIMSRKYKEQGMEPEKRKELVTQELANQLVTIVVHLTCYYGLGAISKRVLMKNGFKALDKDDLAPLGKAWETLLSNIGGLFGFALIRPVLGASLFKKLQEGKEEEKSGKPGETGKAGKPGESPKPEAPKAGPKATEAGGVQRIGESQPTRLPREFKLPDAPEPPAPVFSPPQPPRLPGMQNGYLPPQAFPPRPMPPMSPASGVYPPPPYPVMPPMPMQPPFGWPR